MVENVERPKLSGHRHSISHRSLPVVFPGQFFHLANDLFGTLQFAISKMNLGAFLRRKLADDRIDLVLQKLAHRIVIFRNAHASSSIAAGLSAVIPSNLHLDFFACFAGNSSRRMYPHAPVRSSILSLSFPLSAQRAGLAS